MLETLYHKCFLAQERPLWLGHEDTATTHQYIEADLAMKEAALRRMDAPSSKPARFKAGDRLLAFLETL